MKKVGHVMILASAGSGKTHALTTRFIRLVALGAAPDRIVALTFTRKAAGEFFDRILGRLAGAASDAGRAASLAADVGEPGLQPGDFLRILRTTIDAMHRLKLGTIDGFFARIARTFPFELGLSGSFELLEGHGVRLHRERVLRRMFARTPGPGGAQRDFIEAFKRATFGTEEKRLGRRLDEFLDGHHEVFLGAPVAELWGAPARIWPGGCEFLDGADADRAVLGAELRAALDASAMEEGQRVFLQEFLADFAVWSPGADLTTRMSNILGNVLKAWPGLAEFTVARKKLALPAPAREALRRAVVCVIGAELARHIEITRGIHAVLRGFEAVYHDAVRRSGKLTFADVQRLLEPAPGAGGLAAPALSRTGEGEDRIFIDYRLDAEIDHWLLDEFQDTSFGQWSVLRNLVDEAVQDPTGARSLFYVGDVKQAIFAWRSGDARLFREIFHHYNASGGAPIAEERLVDSWRSGMPVIEMVNRVFGAGPAISRLFPGDASDRWNQEWREHRAARPQLGGQAVLLHAADDEEARGHVLTLLQEIRPLERGLTCAILVQRNEVAGAYAEFVRREGGIPAAAESEINPCTDNPFGAALLALVKAAAHPGDSVAREHVAMSPLAEVLRRQGIDTPDALTRRILSQIHGGGYERTLSEWSRSLEEFLRADDSFSRERARQLVEAAAIFDAGGSRDAGEFLAFMESYRQREPDAGEAVRVMTIHKSKGLDFDVVILPDLGGRRLDLMRNGLGVERARDRSVSWILDLPRKIFLESDPILAAHARAAEGESCYEKLSLLYVAMTRAKHGMYVIAPPAGKSESRNFPRLLADALGETPVEIAVGNATFRGPYATGDSRWHERRTAAPAEGQPARAIEPNAGSSPTVGIRRHAFRRPSDFRSVRELPALEFLSPGGKEARERGTSVHALLAEITWLEAAAIEAVVSRWRRQGAEPGAVAVAESCLRSVATSAIWREPANAAACEVWLERGFEVVVGDDWISGAFDRVVIERSPSGIIRRATLFDFKTDRVEPGKGRAHARRYDGQMRTYRDALQKLTALPAPAISCRVVFVESGEIVEVDLSALHLAAAFS